MPLDDGAHTYLATRFLLRDGDGHPYALCRVATDITGRKRVEESLRADRRRLADAARIADIGSWEWDAAADVAIWSDEMFRTFGLAPQSIPITYESALERVLPEDQAMVHELVSGAYEQRRPVEFEHRIRRPDGSVRRVLSRCEAVIDEHGRLVRMFGSSQDVTEQRRAEDVLRASQRQLAEAQRVAHVGSWEWDIVSNRISWSDELYRIYGIAPGSFAATFDAYLAQLHPDDRDPTRRIVERSLASGLPFESEERIVRPDGCVRTLSSRGRVDLDSRGRPVRMYGICQDVTERKKAEEVLLQTERELRALSAHLVAIREEERGRIAREIHDELGQALTALKIDLSWTRAGREGERDKAKRDERLAGMSSLVDDMIKTVRRIATELRPAVLDDLGLAAAVEWQVQEFEVRTGIRCRLYSSLKTRGIPHDVATAAFRIFQETLTNVARHAQAKNVVVRLGKYKDDVRLEVSDDGRGIRPEALRSRRSLGVLGMRERALHLGGELSIEGAPGRGTTVRVRLPLPARAAAVSRRRPAAHGAR